MDSHIVLCIFLSQMDKTEITTTDITKFNENHIYFASKREKNDTERSIPFINISGLSYGGNLLKRTQITPTPPLPIR